MLVASSFFNDFRWGSMLYIHPQAAIQAAVRDWFVDGIPEDEDVDALVDEIDACGWMAPVDGDPGEEVDRAVVRHAMQAVLGTKNA